MEDTQYEGDDDANNWQDDDDMVEVLAGPFGFDFSSNENQRPDQNKEETTQAGDAVTGKRKKGRPRGSKNSPLDRKAVIEKSVGTLLIHLQQGTSQLIVNNLPVFYLPSE